MATALSLARVLDCTVEDLFGPDKPTAAQSPLWAWPPSRQPCRYWQARVGDRLLRFPSEVSEAGLLEHDGLFIDGASQGAAANIADKTLVMACCDPAIGLLVRQLAQTAGIRLLVLSRSSREALTLLGKGLIHLAGLHLATAAAPDGNRAAARATLGPGYQLLHVARWQEGLALAPHLAIRSVRAALQAKLRWVGREVGSGARQCLDELLGSGPKRGRVAHLARDHRGVAENIRSGWADAGVCVRFAGEEAGLRFLPIRDELFDLCYRAQDVADPRFQALHATIRSMPYRRLLDDLPGYDASPAGELETIH